MARGNAADTATNQFFICIGDQPELDFGGKRNADGQGFAAFGRVIIEANAVGVPVVGANAAGIPEVIEDGKTGLLVPPKDAGAMAAAVSRLLDDKEWRRHMAAFLPAQVSARFDPQRQMGELQRAWSDASARARRRRTGSRSGA